MEIERDLTPRLRKAAREFPAVTLTGPRQSGKSTLCRKVFPKLEYVSLEAPDIRNFAVDDPRGFLAQFPKGAVIDEVQRAPDLPSYLQGIIDDDPKPGRWILTGSQNLSLLESVNQSLAGRTAVLNLLPLSRTEVTRFKRHPKTLDESLFSGGYPRIFDKQLDPSDWLACVCRDVSRARRAHDHQRRRPVDVPALRRTLCGPNRAAPQLLCARRRLRHHSADCEGLAERARDELPRIPAATVSLESAQASREDAEACTSTTRGSSVGCSGSGRRVSSDRIRFAERSSSPGWCRRS